MPDRVPDATFSSEWSNWTADIGETWLVKLWTQAKKELQIKKKKKEKVVKKNTALCKCFQIKKYTDWGD